MSVIKFDIRHPNGQRDSIVIEGERALIGSASHCDVRLRMDQAAYEHVVIEAVGATLRAEAKVESAETTINGMPFTAMALSPEAVLGIGPIRIYVTFVSDLLDTGEVASKRKKETNPAVALGLIAFFGAVCYYLLKADDSAIAPPPAQAPELFAAAPSSCPPSDPAQAAAFGEEQMELGDSKRERLPFMVKDGVAAVTHYESAAVCFHKASSEERAREAEDAARSLKSELMQEFRARRLRLSHMLKVEDYELAKLDVTVLSDLMTDRKGPYVEWLKTVTERLNAKGVQ